jgi:DNA repair protein SbcD/Mre11
MASQVLILGDTHIGKSQSIGKVALGSALNSRVIDQLNLLDWTMDQAVERHIQHIMITGDVFDDPKPIPNLITLFINWLKKCAINNIHVHMVRGNHDFFRTGNYSTSPLDIIEAAELDNVSFYKEIETIFIDDVSFTFIPFRDRKSFNVNSNAEALDLLKNNVSYELASIPMTYKKIVIGHLAFEGSIPIGDEIDDLTNELFCPLHMFGSFDYVWMGHVHKPQVMNQKPYMCHIGSMDISNFGEVDQKKHIVVLDLEDLDNFQEVCLPTRPLKKVVISVPENTQNTTEYVIKELDNYSDLNRSIAKIEIHLVSPDLLPTNRKAIEDKLYSVGIFNVASISEYKKLSPIKKENDELDNTMDVQSAIKMYASSYIEKDLQNAFAELAMDIYSQFRNES